MAESTDQGRSWTVHGLVQGSQRLPYQTVAVLEFAPNRSQLVRWTSSCTCPVGLQCKHAVALVLKAAYLHNAPGTVRTTTPVPPVKKSADQLATETAEREREAQLAQQAAQLRKLTLQAQDWLSDPPTQVPRTSYVNAKPQQPLYLLEFNETKAARPLLYLRLGAAVPSTKGGWNKPRSVSPAHFLQGYGAPVLLTGADRDILHLLGALPENLGSYYHHRESEQWLLNHAAAAPVMELAGASGRLFLRERDGRAGQPLQWGEKRALQWSWHQPEGADLENPLWSLSAGVAESNAVVCANEPMLYLDLAQGRVGALEGGDSAQYQALLKAPPLPQKVMQAHRVALMRRLGDVAPPPVLPALRRVGGVPLWRLHLVPLSETGLADDAPAHVLCARLDFDYEGVQNWWPLDAPRELVITGDDGQDVLVRRDVDSEAQAHDNLRQLELIDVCEGLHVLTPGTPDTRWLSWADADFEPLRQAGFELTVDAELNNWVQAGGAVSLTLASEDAADDGQTRADWFDLSLGLEVNGQRINLLPLLPQIIAELRQADLAPEPVWPAHLYLPHPNGQQFMRVSTEPLKPWLDTLVELFEEKRPRADGDVVRLSRMEALRVQMVLGEGVHWQGAEALRDVAQHLKGQGSLPVTPLPRGLNAQLRPYQQHGLDWLQFLARTGLSGILADDMGLGKTLQTLAHILCEKEAGRLDRPALVVAPVSLLGNWQREAQRFCPDLRVLVLHGAERHDKADDMGQMDVVIIPYSLLYRDRERWLEQPWHLLVLDEAHNIKNTATQAFQVVTELNTRHRLSLSGTPIENHLGEIWSQFHFLMPGFLGSQTRFNQRFRHPIEKHGDTQCMTALRARVTPFILRRHKSDVATELPPKVESIMPVQIDGKQADLYEAIRLSMEETVRQAMADKGLAKSQITILDALLKLRQVCCDPRLVKTKAAAKVKQSAKLEQLMQMLPDMLADGRRILLFSAFTSMLSLIEEELGKRNIGWVKLTGQTQKRDEVIERFTSGQVPVFLISLKAGGVGLNLPQADTVIHYDPWWNPAAENQATDRAHRIGQTQSVWVIKLVAQGTIEERILALQERKAQLARDLYSGSQARKQPLFTAEDVQALLKPLG